MYQLVIVDDEYTIRTGMCNYIDWEAMGFSVAADFEDGKETIAYLEDHHTDVVLTDIEMAEVSGLELARYIKERQLPCKVIILSGYREFEYARKAIEYGVEHYILKPIRMDELQGVFADVKGKLDESSRMREQRIGKEKEFREILPELQEQFWVSILVGGMRGQDSILRKKELLSLDFSMQSPCAVVNVSLGMNPDANAMYYQQRDNRYNLLNNIFGVNNQGLSYYPVYLSPDVLKVIVTASEVYTKEEFEKRLFEQLDQKKEAVEALLTLQMDVVVEAQFQTITDLAQYRYSLQAHVQENDAKNARRIRLVQEDYDRLQQKYRLLMEMISDGDFESLEELVENLIYEFRSFPLDQVKQFMIDMFSMLSNRMMKMGGSDGDFESLEELVENLIYEFRSFPLDQVKQFMIDMFSMLSNRMMKMGGSFWQDVKEILDYQKIMTASDKKVMKEVCLHMLGQVIGVMEKRQSEVSRNIIERAAEYMKQNFDRALSLESLADQYFLNPTYFSRMFRQYMGVTFTDYLIELRMERAKELLCQGKYKVYEVSSKVGYTSDKYFCRVFKQYTGQSPTEYSRSRT